VTHQPKSQLGLALVDRARAWGVPFAFVAADAGYGQTLRQLDGYEASRRRMLETLSNGRHLLLRDSNDSPLIEGLVRDGNLQTVGFTRTGTEYAITPAGKEYVSGGP
jgi:hypothetical protein